MPSELQDLLRDCIGNTCCIIFFDNQRSQGLPVLDLFGCSVHNPDCWLALRVMEIVRVAGFILRIPLGN